MTFSSNPRLTAAKDPFLRGVRAGGIVGQRWLIGLAILVGGGWIGCSVSFGASISRGEFSNGGYAQESSEGGVSRFQWVSSIGTSFAGVLETDPDLETSQGFEIVSGFVGLAAARVADRHTFYNRSIWSGNGSAADPSNDLAIAPDKRALLPGELATFHQYTSYSRGVNGVMVDVVDLGSELDASGATFHMGNSDDVENWASAPLPEGLAVRWGEGVNGSDRIVWVWGDDAVRSAWLEVGLLPGSDTDLDRMDRFYFGNAVGETGDRSTDAIVDGADELAARLNPRNVLRPATLDDRHDFNRDGRVDPADQLIARSWETTEATALRLIQPDVILEVWRVGGGGGEGLGIRGGSLAESIMELPGASVRVVRTPGGSAMVVEWLIENDSNKASDVGWADDFDQLEWVMADRVDGLAWVPVMDSKYTVKNVTGGGSGELTGKTVAVWEGQVIRWELPVAEGMEGGTQFFQLRKKMERRGEGDSAKNKGGQP